MSELVEAMQVENEQVEAECVESVEPSARRRGAALRRALHERGMVTIEYAIGAVLVLVLVGVIIASIQQGWFAQLVQQLVEFLVGQVKRALGA